MKLAFVALAFGLAAAPAQATYSCAVYDQIAPNLTARMVGLIGDEGPWPTLLFEISWAPQADHVVTQQMRWVAIPREATLLWKPDAIAFGIDGPRTDRRGSIGFGYPVLRSLPGRDVAHWSRGFRTTWVTGEDPSVIAALWAAGRWSAEHRDRRRRPRGSLESRLPDAAAAQQLFSRMRAELERGYADPATRCELVPAEEGWDII